MRLASKLILLTAMGLAVVALAASSASAQGLEVSEEPSGAHCNPCITHYVTTASMVIDVHIFGIEFTDSVCNEEFDASVNEDASGTLTAVALSGAGCNREPCPSTPWPITGREGPGAEVLEMTFCVRPVGGGDPLNCSIDLSIGDNGDHIYVLYADDEPCHGVGDPPAEVSGEWMTELNNIEISHT